MSFPKVLEIVRGGQPAPDASLLIAALGGSVTWYEPRVAAIRAAWSPDSGSRSSVVQPFDTSLLAWGPASAGDEAPAASSGALAPVSVTLERELSELEKPRAT